MDITVQRTAWPTTFAAALRLVVIGAQAAAALFVGLAASAGGMFLSSVVLPTSLNSIPGTDPRQFAVPLLVLGALVGTAVAGRASARRAPAGAWLVVVAGSLLICVPVLVVRIANGNVVWMTLGVGGFGSSATASVVVTLTMSTGAGLAVGGILIARPVGARHDPASATAPWVRLIVPAALVLGLVTRGAVNPEWQASLGVLAVASTLPAIALTYWYGRLTAIPREGVEARTGAEAADAGEGAEEGRGRRAGRWWVPATVLLVAQLAALAAHHAVRSRYGDAIDGVLSDVRNVSARTGLIAETLVVLVFAGAVAGYAASRWGARGLRVLGVALGAGFAVGIQIVAQNYPARKPTVLIALAAAIVTVLAVMHVRAGPLHPRAAAVDPPGANRPRAPERRIPWDLVGLGVAGVGAALTLGGRAPDIFATSVRIELIIAGVVMSLIAAVPLARAVPAAGRAPLVAFAVAVFIAGAQVGFGFGGAVFYPVQGEPLPAAYLHQIWILAMVPMAAAVVTALLAWVAEVRRERRMSDSMG
ncbi:MAG TPA: hypothetical protein VKB69_01625 [Micromonosporaceae bacterium]|nr:hypothetical protein [Micromonosporaceae bacterium]